MIFVFRLGVAAKADDFVMVLGGSGLVFETTRLSARLRAKRLATDHGGAVYIHTISPDPLMQTSFVETTYPQPEEQIQCPEPTD